MYDAHVCMHMSGNTSHIYSSMFVYMTCICMHTTYRSWHIVKILYSCLLHIRGIKNGYYYRWCICACYICIFCYIVGTLRKYLMCISALFILGFCVLFASKIPCILMHISVMQKVLFFSAYSWVFRHGVCVIHAYLRRLVLQMSVYIRRRYFYTYYNLYSLFFCVLKACDLYISAFFFIQNS